MCRAMHTRSPFPLSHSFYLWMAQSRDGKDNAPPPIVDESPGTDCHQEHDEQGSCSAQQRLGAAPVRREHAEIEPSAARKKDGMTIKSTSGSPLAKSREEQWKHKKELHLNSHAPVDLTASKGEMSDDTFYRQFCSPCTPSPLWPLPHHTAAAKAHKIPREQEIQRKAQLAILHARVVIVSERVVDRKLMVYPKRDGNLDRKVVRKHAEHTPSVRPTVSIDYMIRYF